MDKEEDKDDDDDDDDDDFGGRPARPARPARPGCVRALLKHRALCDAPACSRSIAGVRWRCSVCDDWDACAACLARAARAGAAARAALHPPSHLLLRVFFPLPPRACCPPLRLDVLYPPGAIPPADALDSGGARTHDTGDGEDAAAPVVVPVVHVGVICDACELAVVGVRYLCAHCPRTRSFDLCEACIDAGAALHHDPCHIFARIEHPLPRARDTPRALCTRLPPCYDPAEIAAAAAVLVGRCRGGGGSDSTSGGGAFLLLAQSRDHRAAREERRRDEHVHRKAAAVAAPTCPPVVSTVTLRAMSPADLPAVVAIENESFVSPYAPEYFARILQGSGRRRRGTSRIVALRGGAVCGYVIYYVSRAHPPTADRRDSAGGGSDGERRRDRDDGVPSAAVAAASKTRPQGKIMSLAVAPAHRRAGVGAALLDNAVSTLFARHGVDSVALQVNAANQKAQRLYVAHGFVAERFLTLYYADEDVKDAVLMIRRRGPRDGGADDDEEERGREEDAVKEEEGHE